VKLLRKKGPICLAKSPNHHNRIYAFAENIESEQLLKDLEKVPTGETPLWREDSKTRAKKLVEKYGWDATEAKKIWCFGPEDKGPNALLDSTRGIAYMNNIRDNVIAAFNWVAHEGALTSSSLRGVKYSVVDAVLHPDAVHRGSGQIVPASRRAFIAAQLTAEPRLVEPIFLVEIQCPEKAMSGVYNTLQMRRGFVFDVTQKSNQFTIKANLPVVESFGFTEALRAQTSGQAFPQCSFSHWQVMEESPFQKDGKVAALIAEIRKKKGLPVEVPALEKFLDKL